MGGERMSWLASRILATSTSRTWMTCKRKRRCSGSSTTAFLKGSLPAMFTIVPRSSWTVCQAMGDEHEGEELGDRVSQFVLDRFHDAPVSVHNRGFLQFGVFGEL